MFIALAFERWFVRWLYEIGKLVIYMASDVEQPANFGKTDL